ncbi:MAG: enolase C-terminal domain-like protein [Bryobacteraceae bacterium]
MGTTTDFVSSGSISAYTIPTETPEADGTADWDSTTVLVVDLRARDAAGLGFSYASEAATKVAEQLVNKVVIGSDPLGIPEIHHAMDRLSRNWGRPGLVSSAIAAVDIALWDLKAKLLGHSFLTLLGKFRDSIPAYGSGGFTSYTEKQLVDQLTGWAQEGFSAVKMKIGRDADADIKRVAAVRRALGESTEIYVDANGAYSRKQALKSSQSFNELGVTWFEEPVTSDDRTGLHLLVERVPAAIRVAAGEYIYVLDDARLLVEAQAVDVLQVDVTRCGGITNFLKISHLAEICHVPLSAHTAPSIHAALCCAAAPAINVEYFYDHQRIEAMLFDGAVRARDGFLTPHAAGPGLGLELKRADAQQFQVFNVECSK